MSERLRKEVFGREEQEIEDRIAALERIRELTASARRRAGKEE